MAYDNVTQLIQLVESYPDTINSTRDLYIVNISLQMNDTMRVLAIFYSITKVIVNIVLEYGEFYCYVLITEPEEQVYLFYLLSF
jgi:magnesium transporter